MDTAEVLAKPAARGQDDNLAVFGTDELIHDDAAIDLDL